MTRRDLGWLAVAAIAATAVVAFASPYTMRVLTIAGAYAIATIGYQLVFGHAGALSLAQGAFAGIGAYVAAILEIRYGLSPAVSLAASVALPASIAAIAGLGLRRLRTHYFALATLILGQLASLVATEWETVTGGANGLAGIPVFGVFGVTAPSRLPLLAVVWGLVALTAFAASVFLDAPRRAAYALMRASPDAAAAAGIDTGRLRAVAFVLGAACAGLAGHLLAHVTQVVSPEILGLPVMVTILAACVIGGRRSVVGAILGAVIVVGLPEWVRSLRDYYLVAYGVLMLACVVLLPNGIAGLLPRRVPPPSAGAEPRRPSAKPRLEITGVAKSFGGVVALADIAVSVESGEIVGLIGPNGSGKTTLLNAICGLVPADAGRIAFGGVDISRLPPHRIARLGIARTFQTPVLAPDSSIGENVAPGRDIDPRHFLEEAGVHDEPARIAAALPFGAVRGIELARALASDPRLLVLDEPASGLGPADRAALSQTVRRVAGRGVAVLVVEHDVPFLTGLASRLVCLDAGRLIADGPSREVVRDPRVIAAYLGVAVRPPASVASSPPPPEARTDR